MGQLTQNLEKLLQKRKSQAEERLSETREWLDKLESAGFNVNDLRSKQNSAENLVERLSML